MKKLILTTMLCTSLLAPMAAGAAKASAPQISDQAKATLHLGLIREHFEKSGTKGGFFSSGSDINRTLLQDLNLFIEKYEGSSIIADALFLKGRMLQDQGEDESAAVTWLQVLYEHPKSDKAIAAKQRLLVLLENEWRNQSEAIKAIINNKASGKKGANLASLIRQLYKVEDRNLIEPLASLQLDFLKRFPGHPDADEVQVLYAHNLSQASAKSAMFAFKKLLALYPSSSYRPEALLACGDIERDKERNYEAAVEQYQNLIKNYSRHALVKNAYINLGQTYEKDLRKYPEAVQAYTQVVSRFPKDEEAMKALERIADIQDRQLKQPNDAVVTLRKLASMFRTKEGIKALEQAMRLADRDLNNQTLKIEIQQQLIKDFPKSEEAAEQLFSMAEFEEDLGHNEKARALYQQLIKEHPNHRYADRAKDRI